MSRSRLKSAKYSFMPEREQFLLFIRPLNRGAVRYIVTGSIAAIFYGEPRLTHDVDCVVDLTDANIKGLSTLFPTPDFYLPFADEIALEVRKENKGHFNIIHADTGFKADMYPVGRDEFNAWAFRHKRITEYQGEALPLAPPEYVIVRKLEYYREGGSEKHLRDIRSMLAVSGDQIDRKQLADWIQRQRLEAEWKKVPG